MPDAVLRAVIDSGALASCPWLAGLLLMLLIVRQADRVASAWEQVSRARDRRRATSYALKVTTDRDQEHARAVLAVLDQAARPEVHQGPPTKAKSNHSRRA